MSSKILALSLGLLCTAIGHAADRSTQQEMRISLEFFVENRNQLDAETKRTIVNKLVLGGILTGIMLNGKVNEYRKEMFAEYSEDFIRTGFLAHGDTVTASPRMLNKDRCIKEVLDLKNMQLVTLRDWAKQEWFDEVTTLDLADNKFTEVPVPFFELFPNLKTVIFTCTPITHLDTKYMPQGLEIRADHTQLASISAHDLNYNGYRFYAPHTPLAGNKPLLNMYRADCKKKPKSVIKRLIETCCGKDIELEEFMVSSKIVTKQVANSRSLQIIQ